MQESRFMRVAAAVGDLGSPFYREERQRDVWNEASAIGFQTMLWLAYVAASASLWIGGGAALPYGLTMVAVAGVGSTVTVAYSRRRGVEPLSGAWITAPRLVGFAVLYLMFVGGVLHAVWELGNSSFRHGLAIGIAVGTFVAILMVAWSLRKKQQAQSDDEA